MSQFSVYIIEDEPFLADCFALAVSNAGAKATVFHDAISAIQSLPSSANELPNLILLDILLSGPNGFTFLNELASYSDTAKIPIAIITSLELQNIDLSHYGVIKVFSKDTVTPDDLIDLVNEVQHAE